MRAFTPFPGMKPNALFQETRAARLLKDRLVEPGDHSLPVSIKNAADRPGGIETGRQNEGRENRQRLRFGDTRTRDA